MSNYTKQISWSGKDALSDSDSEKVISGGDFDTEFSAVQTAINSKIDGGTITNFTSTGIDDNATSTAITIDSAEHVSLAHGIGFNGDTAAANALDDYEEGTWTPVVSFGGNSVGITYDLRQGYYTKVGNLVTINAYVILSGKGTSTGNAIISGLPFSTSSEANTHTTSTIRTSKISFADIPQSYTSQNDAAVRLYEAVGAGGIQTALTHSNFGDASNIILTQSYRV